MNTRSPGPDSLPVSRRQLVKSLGLGAAALALGKAGAWAQSAPTGGGGAAGTPVGVLTLPKLPYAYDALEPHIDARTMEIHHTKHHQAYITAANKALESRPDLRELGAAQLLGSLSAFEEPLRTTLRNQLGGHVNHTFFWTLLAAPADYAAGPLQAAINKRFGSREAFQAEFSQAAMSRFGSGWAWLVAKGDELRVISTPNQDSPLMDGLQPIIGLDVWEHAYYLHYQNRRADYVKAFWTILNWNAAEEAFAAASSL